VAAQDPNVSLQSCVSSDDNLPAQAITSKDSANGVNCVNNTGASQMPLGTTAPHILARSNSFPSPSVSLNGITVTDIGTVPGIPVPQQMGVDVRAVPTLISRGPVTPKSGKISNGPGRSSQIRVAGAVDLMGAEGQQLQRVQSMPMIPSGLVNMSTVGPLPVGQMIHPGMQQISSIAAGGGSLLGGSDIFAAGSANLLQGSRLQQSLNQSNINIQLMTSAQGVGLSSNPEMQANLLSPAANQTLSSMSNVYSAVQGTNGVLIQPGTFPASTNLASSMQLQQMKLVSRENQQDKQQQEGAGDDEPEYTVNERKTEDLQLGGQGNVRLQDIGDGRGRQQELEDHRQHHQYQFQQEQEKQFNEEQLHNELQRRKQQQQQQQQQYQQYQMQQQQLQQHQQHQQPAIGQLAQPNQRMASHLESVKVGQLTSNLTRGSTGIMNLTPGATTAHPDGKYPLSKQIDAAIQSKISSLVNKDSAISAAQSNGGSVTSKPMVPQKLKDKSAVTLKDLSEENFPSLLKRREIVVSKLTSIEKRNLISLNPILPEIPKCKSHWDFVVDEIQWMSVDFRQERRLKYSFLKSLSESIANTKSEGTRCLRLLESEDLVLEKKARAQTISGIVNTWLCKSESSPSVNAGLRRLIELSESAQSKSESTSSVATSLDGQSTSRSFDQADVEDTDRRAKTVLSSSIYTIAGDVPDPEETHTLHDHQYNALKAINTVNFSGLGALLFGTYCTGKTFLAASVVRDWFFMLKKQASNDVEAVKGSTRQIVVFVSRKNFIRWFAELSRLNPSANIHIWNGSAVPSDGFLSADIILCTLEPLIAGLNSSMIEAFTKNWFGVIIDIRGLAHDVLVLKMNDLNLIKYTGKLINMSHWLTMLSSCFPTDEVRRLLLSETSLAPSFDPSLVFESSKSSISDVVVEVLLPGLLFFVCPNIVGPYSDDWLEWTDLKNKQIDVIPVHRPFELLNRVNIILTLSSHAVLGEKATEALETDRVKRQQEFVPSELLAVDSLKSLALLADNILDESYKEDIIECLEHSNKCDSFIVSGISIVETFLPLEMDNLQLKKYLSALEILISHSAFAGDDVKLLGKALTILRRICFHESLINLPKDFDSSIFGSQQKTIDKSEKGEDQTSSDKNVDSGTAESKVSDSDIKMEIDANLENSTQDFKPSITPDAEILPMEDSTQENSTQDFKLPITPDTEILPLEDLTQDFKLPITPDDEVLPRRPLNSWLDFTPGITKDVILNEVSFRVSNQYSRNRGSCKLRNLPNILSIFFDKMVVVLVETDDEVVMIHQHLQNQNIGHQVVGIPGCNDMQDDFNWLMCQDSLKRFNQASTPQVLVLTSTILKSECGIRPTNADVILVLSENWTSCTDLRKVLQLGYLENSNNKKLNIIRVYTKGTLEEALVKSGCTLPCLQGKKLSAIHPPQFQSLFDAISTSMSYNDTGFEVIINTGILTLAPPLSKRYKLIKEGSAGSIVDIGPRKVGIGLGKGKGVLLPVVSFNSLPFASHQRDENVLDDSEFASWLVPLNEEVYQAEIRYNILNEITKFDQKSIDSLFYVSSKSRSLLPRNCLECPVEFFISNYSEWNRPIACKFDYMKRVHQYLQSSEDIFRSATSSSHGYKHLDVSLFLRNGIGVSPTDRNLLALFQPVVTDENLDAIELDLEIPINPEKSFEDNQSSDTSVVSVASSVSRFTSSDERFQRILELMQRSGNSLDAVLYMHPLQHAAVRDVSNVSHSYRQLRLNSQYVVKFIARAGAKSQKRTKIQQKSDAKKRSIDNPLGISLKHSSVERRRLETTSVEQYISSGRSPYGPRPFPSLRKNIKFVRESNISQEPWSSEEDAYIMAMVKKYGENCWWLIENSMVCSIWGSWAIRSARQIRERYYVLFDDENGESKESISFEHDANDISIASKRGLKVFTVILRLSSSSVESGLECVESVATTEDAGEDEVVSPTNIPDENAGEQNIADVNPVTEINIETYDNMEIVQSSEVTIGIDSRLAKFQYRSPLELILMNQSSLVTDVSCEVDNTQQLATTGGGIKSMKV
jgi:hypothetical protein